MPCRCGCTRCSPAACPALPSPPLLTVGREGRPLRVAAAGHGDDDLLVLDEVLVGEVLLEGRDLRPAVVAEPRLHVDELLLHDRRHPRRAGEDVLQVGDEGEDVPVLGDDLVALEAGVALETQLEDRLRLRLVETHEAAVAAGPRRQLERLDAEEALERGEVDGDLPRQAGLAARLADPGRYAVKCCKVQFDIEVAQLSVAGCEHCRPACSFS